MNRYFIIICFVTAIFSYSCKSNVGNEVEIITSQEMQEFSEINDVQLVDIKTSEEKESCDLNSQNIDYYSPTFDVEIEALDKSKPVIVFCESSSKNDKCVAKMEDAGYIKIYDVNTSIAKWKFKGIVIKSAP